MFRLILIIACWIAFVSAFHLHDVQNESFDSAILVTLDTESARQHCDGLEVNFRKLAEFLRQNSLSHSSVYQMPRSPRLQAAIKASKVRLETDPEAECERLWKAYGQEGEIAELLLLRGEASIPRPYLAKLRFLRLEDLFMTWIIFPQDLWVASARRGIHNRSGRSTDLSPMRLM